jgi:hypothetical protein
MPSFSYPEAERFLLFAMLVAGKRSDVQDEKLRDFLSQSIIADDDGSTFTLVPPRARTNGVGQPGSPFEWIRKLDEHNVLEATCRKHKLGKYTTIVPGFRQLAASDIDILDTGVEELQEISGIGPKTSRFYLLRTGQLEDAAALDTHILSWLQDQGYDAPGETPSPGLAYDKWQDVFIEEADRRGLTPSGLDARIWNEYSESSLAARA